MSTTKKQTPFFNEGDKLMYETVPFYHFYREELIEGLKDMIIKIIKKNK